MCEELEDMCAPGRSPCQHQSTCLISTSGPKWVLLLDPVDDISASYLHLFGFVFCRCVCSPGYVGDDCSINYDDCRENRCQNGAQCVDELNGYSCICPEGYRLENLQFTFCTVSTFFYPVTCMETPPKILPSFDFKAVSCVKFLHLVCRYVSWLTAKTTPPVWREVAVPSANVLQSSEVHAAKNWSASTLWIETLIYCYLTWKTGHKLTSPCR